MPIFSSRARVRASTLCPQLAPLVAALFTLVALRGAPARADESDPVDAKRAPSAESLAQQAEERAEQAEPTPIVPSPRDPLRPAYQLYAEFDLPVLGIGLVFAASRLVREQPAYCAPLCEVGELNALDRRTAGFWSPAWRLTSDLALGTMMGGALALLIADEGFFDALNDAVVVAEAALASVATVSIMTLATNRPRPFLYGEDAPLADRNSSDASLSFLSSHAAVAFSLATTTFITMRRLHPRGKLPWIVGGIGGGLATLVAVSRIFAGRHFITDAVGGSIVGVSLGVLIPALHASPMRLAPNVSGEQRGLSFVGRF